MNGPKSILYSAPHLGGANGGAQSAVDVLIALLSAKHEVHMLSASRCDLASFGTPNSLGEPIWSILGEGKPLYPQVDRDILRRITGWAKDAFNEYGVRQRLDRAKPNLIIVNEIGGHRQLERIKDWHVEKRAIIVRSQPSHQAGMFTDSTSNFERVMKEWSRYPYIISVSSRVLEDWRRVGALEGKKTFYIPNCCREDKVAKLLAKERQAVRRELGITDDEFAVACVGSVQYRKGQDVLLSQFEALKGSAPNIRIYLLGPIVHHWGAEDLVRRVRAGEFGDSVKIMGYREDAMAFTYASDLFVLPSRSEALPRSILEAMALKTPVIASDVAGIPEMIDDRECGLLFSHDNPAQLADHIIALYRDKSLRERFAWRAHEKYWETFSRKHQVERFGAAIDEMLSDS